MSRRGTNYHLDLIKITWSVTWLLSKIYIVRNENLKASANANPQLLTPTSRLRPGHCLRVSPNL